MADGMLLELFRKTKKLNAEWKQLGLMLKLDKHVLDTIEKNNPRDATHCRMEMLHAYLKDHPADPREEIDTVVKEIQKCNSSTSK